MSQPGLTAGAVARRLGVAVTTLRTWHQRYGLGPSLHEPGQHRRYTPDDVARLETMQRLVVDGVPPGDAARWVLRDSRLREPGGQGEPEGRRDGGGLALHEGGPAARGLSRAALRLDAAGMREQLVTAIAELGVPGAWESVIRPVLAALGERHAERGTLVEAEHLLSGCVSAALAGVRRPPRAEPTRTLLACVDEEQHSLPLEALAAALAEVGVPCRMLGARVPTPALLAAVRRTGPLAVVLWSHHPSTADPAVLTAILRERARPLLVAAAGPGWRPGSLPAAVTTPGCLAEALAAVVAAAT